MLSHSLSASLAALLQTQSPSETLHTASRDLLQDGMDEAAGKVQGNGSAVKQGQSSWRKIPNKPIKVCCSVGFITATS